MTGAEPPQAAPWRQLAAFALGHLRWPPAVLWAATPAEVRLAVHGLAGWIEPPEFLTRAEMAALQRRFPDHT